MAHLISHLEVNPIGSYRADIDIFAFLQAVKGCTKFGMTHFEMSALFLTVLIFDKDNIRGLILNIEKRAEIL